MARLFVGIELPGDVRAELAGLKGGLVGARWVEAENLHLTLRFIGEVAEDQAEELDAALASVASPGFEMALLGLDCFHSRRRVRAVWTGAVGGDALAKLRTRIESALVRAGCEPEHRKFTPHVTLARLKHAPLAGVRPYLESHAGFRLAPFAVESFQLFRSHLGHGGARYEVLADYPLSFKDHEA
jgi:2'-5' RNA ligase